MVDQGQLEESDELVQMIDDDGMDQGGVNADVEK